MGWGCGSGPAGGRWRPDARTGVGAGHVRIQEARPPCRRRDGYRVGAAGGPWDVSVGAYQDLVDAVESRVLVAGRGRQHADVGVDTGGQVRLGDILIEVGWAGRRR